MSHLTYLDLTKSSIQYIHQYDFLLHTTEGYFLLYIQEQVLDM